MHRNAEDGSFSFQLLSETSYAPEQFRFRGGDPRQAAEQIYAELRDAARRAGPGADGTAADTARLRSRLKNQGVQLWTSAVPEAIQRQFWEQADRITSITVLGEHDFVPWELLYPLDPHHDNGFLVVRRVFGQDRVDRLALPGAAFVVPPGSPPDADLEIAALRKWLGPNVANAGVFTESIALTALVERGHAGLLHFACHNAFSGSGSRVSMGDGTFDPIDLATAVQTRSLLSHRPLVFFNACRSAGEIDWFGSTLGWAQQFLQAGAGAFIGTLWPVRSDSAMLFAQANFSAPATPWGDPRSPPARPFETTCMVTRRGSHTPSMAVPPPLQRLDGLSSTIRRDAARAYVEFPRSALRDRAEAARSPPDLSVAQPDQQFPSEGAPPMSDPVFVVHGVANRDGAGFTDAVKALQSATGIAMAPVYWGDLGAEDRSSAPRTGSSQRPSLPGTQHPRPQPGPEVCCVTPRPTPFFPPSSSPTSRASPTSWQPSTPACVTNSKVTPALCATAPATVAPIPTMCWLASLRSGRIPDGSAAPTTPPCWARPVEP
ncbi:CHAT domain-containing protein [Streptomyces sp. NPDC058686]|uniref:CHAT domain-containing protein n=1 Tax=Streptomyces sp. NPDC058686 TaxID=3346599 RepID=UPI0036678ECF